MMRRRSRVLRGTGIVLAVLSITPLLLAAAKGRPVGRFDHLEVYREGGSIGVDLKPVESLSAADPLRHGWEAFRQQHGGRWKILVDERSGMPALVSGAGVRLFDEADEPLDLYAVESLARAFLDGNKTILGDWRDTLKLDPAASGRIVSDYWQLVFRQYVDGVRVENARLDMHIKRGRLVLFGAAHWARVTTSATPALSVDQARVVLDDYLRTSTSAFVSVREPRLSLIALAPEGMAGATTVWSGPRGEGISHALVWRFEFLEPGKTPLWIAEIDAHEGYVRSLYDGAHYATVRGGVFPISNDGDCADDGCEIAGFPMPFADFTETGQTEEFADTFGNLACVDSMETFETNLEGPYVRIVDDCGAVVETGTCTDGIDLGLKAGENCDVDPAGSPGNSAAARTAYYHINRIFEAARFYDTTSTWLADQVDVEVNQPGSCNAFWNTSIRMLGEGGGCGNTGEQSGVLVHEWGHGYDHNDGGGEDVPSEAYADVVTIFYNRDSCISRGWYNDGRTCTGYGDTCLTCTGIRDHDWAARVNNTPATPLNFTTSVCPSGPGGPCGREAHCEGYPIGEAIFDLATRDLPSAGLDQDTAWQLAERLWYSTRLGGGGNIYDCFRPWLAHSCFAYSWMQRMLVADDDDGDLSNGTPHAAALFAAFDRHEISCGAVDDPENQSTSSCPALAAPVLSLVETPGSGTQLNWPAIAGAGEVRVYRGELGCDRQQIPIASLPGVATSYLDTTAAPDLPRYYRVEALGASPACHSPVSNCETTPLSARVHPQSLQIVESGVVNGIPDPGETVVLPVTIFNAGLDTSIGTQGTLVFADPAQGQVLGGQATWADIPSTGSAESDSPHFEVEVFDTVNCGDTVVWEVDATASNSITTRKRFSVVLGEKNRDFENLTSEPIPDQTVSPLESAIVIAEDEAIAELDVSVSITHDEPTELVVELTSPQNTTVRLHDRTAGTGFGLLAVYDTDRSPDGPGTMQDFAGESTAGTWTLAIEDLGAVSTAGTLNSWKLHTIASGAYGCEEAACAAAPPTLAADGFALDKNATDLDFAWDPVAMVAGYHVVQTTDKTFASGEQLTGATAGATNFTLPGGTATTPALTFFQVRAINECGVEGP